MKRKLFYSVPIAVAMSIVFLIASMTVAYARDPKLNRPNEWREKNTFAKEVVFSDTVDASDATLTIPDGGLEAADVALAQGSVLVGDSNGEASALSAKGDTKILVGNGTTITSVAISGDATMANTGALTIAGGAVTSAKMALPNIQSVTFSLSYADFTAIATSETIEVGGTIPKGAFVLRTLIDNVIKFEGGTVSAATLTIGDSDEAGGTTDPDRYNTGTPDVFATADVLDAGAVSGTALHATSSEAVTATLTLTGDNCVNLTAGSARVTIFYLQAVDHS
jgi:hypothetical protein